MFICLLLKVFVTDLSDGVVGLPNVPGKTSVLAHPTVARVDRILASSPIYYGKLRASLWVKLQVLWGTASGFNEWFFHVFPDV